MTEPLTPPGQSPGGTGHPGHGHPGDGGTGPHPSHAHAPPAYAPHPQAAHAYQSNPYAAPPYQPPAGGSGPPSGTFGLALAGTILGSVALILTLATMVLPMLLVGGMWGGGFDEEVTFDQASPEGTLPQPDADGYTPAEVTTAVSEALESFVYPITVECPGIGAGMARDLEGRTVICEGDDAGWTMTVFVVFTDADGGFIATPY